MNLNSTPDNRADKTKGGICHSSGMDDPVEVPQEPIYVTQIPEDWPPMEEWTPDHFEAAEHLPKVPYIPPTEEQIAEEQAKVQEELRKNTVEEEELEVWEEMETF